MIFLFGCQSYLIPPCRAFVTEFKRREKEYVLACATSLIASTLNSLVLRHCHFSVHMIICNAGVFGLPYMVSPGSSVSGKPLETTFTTNYLGSDNCSFTVHVASLKSGVCASPRLFEQAPCL